MRDKYVTSFEKNKCLGTIIAIRKRLYRKTYEYHNIAFDIRYNLGLTHVYKNMTDNAHNSTLMFTLGYGIDL